MKKFCINIAGVKYWTTARSHLQALRFIEYRLANGKGTFGNLYDRLERKSK